MSILDTVFLISNDKYLGQLVGDWYEEHFVLPLLQKVATHLKLYLDHRFRNRTFRTSDKLFWTDEDGNSVDYDFVMEMDGTDAALGIPVAFFECFWRRGSRHSKDKARDDSGKLMPMRDVHPTARFLGIVAGGDFTVPARTLVQSRQIDLFYVPKAKIVASFAKLGLEIDYHDKLGEEKKALLANTFEKRLTEKTKRRAAQALCELVGDASLDSYIDRVRASLGALPQEIRFISQRRSRPAVFESIDDASDFLSTPEFDVSVEIEDFIYQITYSDGTEFERAVASIDKLKMLHHEIERLANHVNLLARGK